MGRMKYSGTRLKAKTALPVPIPVTVERNEFKDREEARIREAYARRQECPQGTYSFLNNPSFVLQIQERDSGLLSMLSQNGVGSLEGKRILDIGCGTGYWLLAFLQWGVLPENVIGIDLSPERIEQARERCPHGVHLECGNAAALDFPDASFDLVLQATVFTSILDPEISQRIAAEMLRVLKSGGFVVWYDFFLGNPRNPDVRGVRRGEIRRLFPGCQIHLRRITLAPPIGRLVGHYSPFMYMLLSWTKILCTHYLGLIKKN
jgi:ubiquinone/menaquinone biosynthesis C-methylase UbiE